MKLDLACGQNVREGFMGVDIINGYDLLGPWIWWDDDSIEELHCSHFIEHIPASNGFSGKDYLFWFFDEAYRVIKPQGKFTVIWPALQSVRAFQDPTHRRFIPLATMCYLSKTWRQANRLSHYNVDCDWEIESARATISDGGTDEQSTLWNIVGDYQVILVANK